MLLTKWGEDLLSSSRDEDFVPLQEYPRPQMQRQSWQNLNGWWEYAITPLRGDVQDPRFVDDPTELPPQFLSPDASSRAARWEEGADEGRILVPFSPEFPLSGVSRKLSPDETLWYRRQFAVLARPTDRVLLHFGAVDQSCRVAVNGTYVGGNFGGYLPFALDITDEVNLDSAPNTLVVAVRDVTDTSYFSRGKQSSNPGGIWYTPQSGIWQTVWIEVVPAHHIADLLWEPTLDSAILTISAPGSEDQTVGLKVGSPVLGAAFMAGSPVLDPLLEAEVPIGVPTEFSVPSPENWTPEHPWIYPVELTLASLEGADTVYSYFALRTLGVGERADGKPALLLNGKPQFVIGLLDQGYWPDGGYTAPSDAALKWDIQFAKAAGYNMLRKHIKIEPLRWYHHCDRLGILVWQDAVNGGRPPRDFLLKSRVVLPYPLRDKPGALLGRQDPEGLTQYREELARMVAHLRSVPSLALWVPFNEGWGQFDAAANTERLRELDPSRPIDHASGWFDQGAGDLHSVHVYMRPPVFVGLGVRDSRVLALTEYGGLGLPVPGHRWSDASFGYLNFKNPREFARGFEKLHRQLGPALGRGLGALVYTQLSDVEEELNGLVTYDRRVVKMPLAELRQINNAVAAHAN